MDKLIFAKPISWKYMPLYEKIGYFKTVLDERYSQYVDKLKVKEIVKVACPELKTANVVRILCDTNDIFDSDMNTHHILKSTHGSGYNIRLDGSCPVEKIKELLKTWDRPYSDNGEAQYKYIKPMFFIEEIIDDYYTGKSGLAQTFMVRCIHGKPVNVRVRCGNGSKSTNTYTIDFKMIMKQEFLLEKPNKWQSMLDIAEKLSEQFEFVRLDFYIDSHENIYLSEFTFTPSAGNPVFSPAIERELGKLWI